MTDLAAWILERIADDEATARAYRDGDWSGNPYAGDGDGSDLRYAERFDPARVLAQCAAIRAVVERLSKTIAAADAHYEGPDYYGGVDACEDTLRALASVWVDHPDYDPVWRLA